MADLSGKRIAVLSTHGFEQSELMVPRDKLRELGAMVDVVSPEDGQIRGWSGGDWGDGVKVDAPLDGASAEHYDALVLPGGQINPDLLRVNEKAVKLIRSFHDSGRTIAAICHAPWLLIEAGLAKGLKATSYKSIRTDMVNAGADWRDEPVATDKGIVTSRRPDDLDAFVEKIAEEVLEGRHERRSAA